MMLKITLLSLCACILLLSPVYAQNTPTVPPPLEIGALYWYPEVSGHVRVSNDGQSTDVNLRSDLGLHNYINVPGAQVNLNLGPESSIRASYIYLYDTGSNTLSRTIVFNGHTYPASTSIDSKIIAQYFSLGWLWDFLHTDDDRFKLGFILDATGISTRATASSASFGSSSEHFTGAAPTPGLSAEYRIVHPLGVYAEAKGIPAGHYGYFLDAQGGLRVHLSSMADLSAGYRIIEAKVDYNDSNNGEVTFKGPFAGVTFKF